jgi:hypothetical protein
MKLVMVEIHSSIAYISFGLAWKYHVEILITESELRVHTSQALEDCPKPALYCKFILIIFRETI